MLRLTIFSSFFFLMIRRPPRSTLFPTRRSSDLTLAAHKQNTTRPVGPTAVRTYALMPVPPAPALHEYARAHRDRKSTRLNSSHGYISYAVFCLKKKNNINMRHTPPEQESTNTYK